MQAVRGVGLRRAVHVLLVDVHGVRRSVLRERAGDVPVLRLSLRRHRDAGAAMSLRDYLNPGWFAPSRWWAQRQIDREITRANEDAEAEREQRDQRQCVDTTKHGGPFVTHQRLAAGGALGRDTGEWEVIYDGNSVDSPGFLGEKDYCQTVSTGGYDGFNRAEITYQWWRLGRRFEYDRDGRSYVRVWARKIDDPRPS
jgi:hypothetical protein